MKSLPDGRQGGKMANKVKSIIVLFVILILLSLSLLGGVFHLLQKERAKNLALQDELGEIKTRQKITENKLQESQKLISNLELKLKEAKTEIDTLASQLSQEKTAKLEANALIEQLRIDLEQQKVLRTDLEKKFNLAQKDMERIQVQLKELESKKIELETKINDLEEQSKEAVELGKIIVSPETAVATHEPVQTQPTKERPQKKSSAAGLEGKVLVINKDYNFAVLNLGSKDGIDIGNVFSVYHNNKYIGDVKVEKVHDSMAAAGFVSSDIKNKINEGDKVIRKTK